MSKEATYDEQIAPLMDQIIALCKMHGIGMMATFAIHGPGGVGSEGELYCTTHLPADLGIFDPATVRAVRALRINEPASPGALQLREVERDGRVTITRILP